MHIQIIGVIGSRLVAMLGEPTTSFSGSERIVVIDLREGKTWRSRLFDSMMGHTHGTFQLMGDISKENRAAAIELARKHIRAGGI